MSLLGAGWWWQRRAAKESLRNYAQVLFAGGLAACYFTTYAAHHIEPLRVITSPVLDGVLLLGWAGFMVWIADRKKSQVLALFAVCLAYLACVLTPAGKFTLYSNVVLTAAAVFFLVRNRWAALSFVSLAATYGAYGYWRFFNGSAWHWPSPEAGLWAGVYFLGAYWVLLTSGVFLSRDKQFSGENRATFLTLNNGAFFSLFLLTMLQVQHGGFWKLCLVYGTVLLALAEAARRVLPLEPQPKNFYLSQGLLLVTMGIVSHPRLAGLNLALVLAAESVLLLMSGQMRKNLVLLVGAYVAAALSAGWGMDGMMQHEAAGAWLAAALGGFMVVNSVLAHRKLPAARGAQLRFQPGYFAFLALLVWLAATWDNTARQNFPVWLAGEALLLTASILVLRVPEFPLLGQGYALLAQAAWFLNWLDPAGKAPWWNPALLIAFTLALNHYWQKQKRLAVSPHLAMLWQGLYSLAIVCVLWAWLDARFHPPTWLAFTSLLAVVLTGYGVATRAWLLAAGGQIFMLISAGQFALQLMQGKPAWYIPLAPMAALSVLSFGVVHWFRARPQADAHLRDPLMQLSRGYRWVALLMSIVWVCNYAPERERIWLLALIGLWLFLWAGLKTNREALLMSAAFTVVGLVFFWLPLLEAPAIYWPNLVAILALLAQRQLARRLPKRYPIGAEIHNAVMVLGGLSLWLFVSRWVLELKPGGFYLTASWSVLALGLFAAGIGLRERMYRWEGLGILACALARVLIIDVWSLAEAYRILSFMALGAVLLVLGFIYNKYQEKIREWL